MTKKINCRFRSSDSYEIEIGPGLMYQQGPFLAALAPRIAIISDDKVASLHGDQLVKSLSSIGLEVHLLAFPAGEKSKTRETKAWLEDQLFDRGVGRDSCIVALGGGVVTDIGGFVAATFCRGVPFVSMPTSLLGMVDAAIGGKNGVNVPHGKNMVGSVYHPKKVVIDPLSLKTSSRAGVAQGTVEIIKHGLIASRSLYDYLDAHSQDILDINPDALENAIYESCRIKMGVVEEDEREEGKRRTLNFGHTIGHALERLTGYSLSHGEAVAIGILVESFISVQLGMLPEEDLRCIKSTFQKYALPLHLPCRCDAKAVIEAMTSDKKSVKGKPRFVIIDKIGSTLPFESSYCTPIEESLITNAINWMNHDLCCH